MSAMERHNSWTDGSVSTRLVFWLYEGNRFRGFADVDAYRLRPITVVMDDDPLVRTAVVLGGKAGQIPELYLADRPTGPVKEYRRRLDLSSSAAGPASRNLARPRPVILFDKLDVGKARFLETTGNADVVSP